ncbi:MAG: hypothetical protein NVSMB57_05590 [Actinomycetota bacterium]
MLWPSDHLAAVLTFAAFILVTELFDTELPSGRQLRLSVAPALGFAMLEGARRGAGAAGIVVATFLVATGIACLGRMLLHREVRWSEIMTSMLSVAAATAAYGALRSVGTVRVLAEGAQGSAQYFASVTGLAAVLAIALLTEPVRALVMPNDSKRLPAAGRAVVSSAPLQTAMVSVGALVALAFPKLNWWSFPLFLGPLAATRYAFRQIATIRTTEVQTLRALSKIPEMAGYTAPGHSRRVAELSVAMASDLGIAENDRRNIEYAALLHDIGRVVLGDPDAERTAHLLDHEVAVTGSNIVAAAGTFPAVAEMIRQQHDPYRAADAGLAGERSTIGSRILKVANAYDDLLTETGAGSTAVVARLRRAAQYDFDPDVVASLVRVLSRGDMAAAG